MKELKKIKLVSDCSCKTLNIRKRQHKESVRDKACTQEFKIWSSYGRCSWIRERYNCVRSQQALTSLVNAGNKVVETGALTEIKLYKCATLQFLEHHTKVITHLCLGLLKPAHTFDHSLIQPLFSYFLFTLPILQLSL